MLTTKLLILSLVVASDQYPPGAVVETDDGCWAVAWHARDGVAQAAGGECITLGGQLLFLEALKLAAQQGPDPTVPPLTPQQQCFADARAACNEQMPAHAPNALCGAFYRAIDGLCFFWCRNLDGSCPSPPAPPAPPAPPVGAPPHAVLVVQLMIDRALVALEGDPP